MITRLRASLPNHTIVTEDSKELFVVDYTHIHNGKVVILSSEPDHQYVYIDNPNSVPIYFDGFEYNALEISPGLHSPQCECIMFPQAGLANDWILVIETKYVTSFENAFREINNYPKGMINQVIETVRYFRNKGIIEDRRRVNAIVSFPTLIEDFDAIFFTGELSIEDILIEHQIKIRATNRAEILSHKRINI